MRQTDRQTLGESKCLSSWFITMDTRPCSPGCSQLIKGGLIFRFFAGVKIIQLLSHSYSCPCSVPPLSQSWGSDEDDVCREAVERNANPAEPDRRTAGFWREWHSLIGNRVSLQGYWICWGINTVKTERCQLGLNRLSVVVTASYIYRNIVRVLKFIENKET